MRNNAQTFNKRIEDISRHKTILINECTREGLVTFPEFKEQYDIEYPKYSPKFLMIEAIRPHVKDKQITMVLGTWCGDSKIQIPRFLKILDELDFAEKDLSIICTDGLKKTEGNLLNNMKIDYVPTILFYTNDKELGRITESPFETLEEDMYHILNNK